MLKRTLHDSAATSAPLTPETYAPRTPGTPASPPATPDPKRARLAARATARFAARVIDLTSSPFAFVDLTSPPPSSPEGADDFSDAWSARLPALLSPSLKASSSTSPNTSPRASPRASPGTSPRASPDASPSPALLASPGAAWDAELDDLKARLPALHSAFIRKLTAAPSEPGPSPFDGSTSFSPAHAANYIAHLPRWARASESVEIAAHIYIERMCAQAPGLAPSPRNVRRLFAVALLLSCKMHEEVQYRMVHWAEHCGIRLPELLALERKAMDLLKWNLHVSPAELEAFVARLQ
jgi:hypothetical protein